MNFNQIEIAESAVKVYCVSVLWSDLGAISYLMFLPLLANKNGISGVVTGLVLAMSAVMSVCTFPLSRRYISTVGVEFALFSVGLTYSFAFIILAIASFVDAKLGFLIVAFISSGLIGMAYVTAIFAEKAFLLKYSSKEDREKTQGKFRLASGVGCVLSTLVGSIMFAIGKFAAVYLFVGVGFLVIPSIVYYKLYKVKDQF